MKKLKPYIVLIFFILIPVLDCFGQLKSRVDERMELTSIVFRIAGIEEFTNDNIPEYAKAIDSWFGKYESHKLIDLIKEMRKEHGLGFAGVAASVPFLVIDENGVHDSELRTGSEIEGRWTDENWEEYVRLLDDFYHKSRFHKFFISQQELYGNAIRTMDSYLTKIDTSWFRSFFGEYEEPVVYAAIANGYNNYYFDDPTLYHDGYGIAIGYTGGYPNDVVLHEMCHRYTLISDEYYPQVEEAMRRIFETSDLVEIFLRNRYGSPKTVFNEWLTDLTAALYMKEHYGIHFLKVDAPYLGYAYGYIWTPRAAQFMDNFYANRDIYPYFKDFMPRICEFMNYTTSMDNWMKVLEENDTEKPYIVNTYPVEGTCLADYGRIDEIRVTFSEPMNTKAIGFKASFPVNDNPFDTFGAYWKDSITLIIPLFENAEIKDTTYMIRFNNSYIQSIGSLEGLNPDNSQIVYEQKKEQYENL